MELCSVVINILIVSNSARAELIHQRRSGLHVNLDSISDRRAREKSATTCHSTALPTASETANEGAAPWELEIHFGDCEGDQANDERENANCG